MTLAELYLKDADKYRKKGEYEKAVKEYRAALKSGDLNKVEIKDTFNKIVDCYIYLKKWNDAKICLDQSLKWGKEHNLNCYNDYYNFGRLYYDQNDFTTAVKYFKQAIEVNGKRERAWWLYGLSTYYLGQEAEAVNILETALKLAIANGSDIIDTINNDLNVAKVFLVYLEGLECFEKKEFELAIEKFDQALALDRKVIDKDMRTLAFIHLIKGECLLLLKSPDEAFKEFDKASAFDSEIELDVLSYLGMYYQDKKDFKNALSYYSKGLQKCKDCNSEIRDGFEKFFTTRSLYVQAMIAWAIDKNSQRALRIIESVKPCDEWTRIFIPLLHGKILNSLGKYWEAIACLKELCDSNTSMMSALGHGHIGCSYQKMGHYETALRYIEKGLSKGDIEDATVWVSKGECHLHLKQYDEALESYRKALVNLDLEAEYTAPEIEAKIKSVKQMQEQTEKNKETKKHPASITIQGNNNPINLGGILATDDAVINRPTIQKEEEVITAFCPQCGCKVDAEDRFCRKCGGKLR